MIRTARAMDFLMLGPVEVRTSAGPVLFGGNRSRGVLAALLLSANRVVSVEQIVDAVWGDHPPAGARVQARNRVSRLRQVMPDTIVTSGSGYLLRVDDERLDTTRFTRGVGRAEQLLAAGDAAAGARELATALALWRGPALDGLHTPYLMAAAQGLEEQRIRAVERRIEIEIELGRHAELVGELIALTAEHPYRERLHALLMLALHRGGRRAEALDVYQRARADLADQLGVEPGEQLRRTHAMVLGAHDEPVVRQRAPRELPGDVAGFTGRVELLSRLDAQARTATIITVTGGPGVGKTAIAVHWAHRVADEFPDGQLFVDLRGFTAPLRPIAVLATFLRALGIPAAQVPVDEPEAAALFRSVVADRRMLILLDNAHSAEQVRPLLPGTRGSLVLVTSRDRLTGLTVREGARRLPVGRFRPEESRALLAHFLGEERIAAQPHAVAELCASCAQLPLALRVAAAALRESDRLAPFAINDNEMTLVRRAFDVSYQAIRPPEQRLFRLLGLASEVDAGAAVTLAGVSPAEAGRLLDRLASAHLVEEHAPGRYSQHALLRAYAIAQRHGHAGRLGWV
jgi:DNA-binding SARP family transcriptional activator